MRAAKHAAQVDRVREHDDRGRGVHVDAGTERGSRYKWIALSNTTLGLLMATINSSIVLIALPDIFRGIHINPLSPANTSYLLWMIMGFLVVTAVLVVGFGRLGDMYGRVRMYNLGFAIFTVSSVLLWVTWLDGTDAAMWLIGWRVVQGIGGAFLFANSSAILTDAFPANQRGLALGINATAAIAGSFLGLVVGGLLGPINWHFVFLVSVPFGVLGTVWGYFSLRDTGVRQKAGMDWWGNITFAVGLIAVLVGITYGIQPYGGHVMGWTSPLVLVSIIGGVVILILFAIIEARVSNPLFNLALFKIRAFTAGNIANLLAALGRGGLQFMLIIWLQGIWLPLHGYSFESTPLWAGIYMLPLTIGFLVSAPLSGVLSDRMGSRAFTVAGMTITAATFVLLALLPANFNYWEFAALLLVNGLGTGLFSSPNRADVMNSLPAHARGAGAGMTATFQNSAMVLSIGVFFSLMIAGLSRNLPSAMYQGLVQHAVPTSDAQAIAQLPPVGVLFSAFLGYNPLQQLLGPVLNGLPPDQAAFLTGRGFFPQLISGPFSDGLVAACVFAVAASVVAAVASWLGGTSRKAAADTRESVGAELAATAGEASGVPSELVGPARTPASNNGHPKTVLPLLNGATTVEASTAITGAVRTVGGAETATGVVTVTGPDGTQAGRAVVDQNGRYTFSALPPGAYTLIASAPGFQPTAAAVTVPAHGAIHHDLVLRGGGVLTGTVRSTATGPAVPSATVVAIDTEGHTLGQVTTSQDGTFRLSGLPAGALTVAVSAPDHEPAAVPASVSAGPPAVVDVVLPPFGRVSGTVVVPNGFARSETTVSVVDASGWVVGSTTADENGRYHVTGLPRGEYTLVASAHQVAAVRVSVGSAEATSMDVAIGGAVR